MQLHYHHMEQPTQDQTRQIETFPQETRVLTTSPIAQYRNEERLRWKRRVWSLIFVGILISILVHLIIFLQFSGTVGGSFFSQQGEAHQIELAVLDEESFTDLPEGEQLTQSQLQSEHTEASADVVENTQAILAADTTGTALLATEQSRMASLTGSGTAGMGLGMGGSGGGGTSFFGITSSGTRFCYIVDRSSSMGKDNFAKAKAELIASLEKLPDFARFFVLFYSTDYIEPGMQQGWNTARRRTVTKMAKEILQMTAHGGTNPLPAFVKAFELKPPPDTIFFLTDGEISPFSNNKLQEIMPKGKKIVVNTIAFGDDTSQKILQEIANATGGKYNYVP